MANKALDALDAQIKLSTEQHIKYDEHKLKLKEMFYNYYQPNIVVKLLALIMKNGHPADRERAKRFRDGYINDNFDESDVKWFKDAMPRYNEKLMKVLNEEEDNT